MENITNGSDLMLFMASPATGPARTLAFATSHKLSINAETTETTSKDHGAWSGKTAKKITWNISSENLFIETGDTNLKQNGFGDLFDLMTARTEINVVFTTTFTAAHGVSGAIPPQGWDPNAPGSYGGKAIITNLEANAPHGENATYSILLEGVGELSHIAVEEPTTNTKSVNTTTESKTK